MFLYENSISNAFHFKKVINPYGYIKDSIVFSCILMKQIIPIKLNKNNSCFYLANKVA